jgi:hypothetical protein
MLRKIMSDKMLEILARRKTQKPEKAVGPTGRVVSA